MKKSTVPFERAEADRRNLLVSARHQLELARGYIRNAQDLIDEARQRAHLAKSPVQIIAYGPGEGPAK